MVKQFSKVICDDAIIATEGDKIVELKNKYCIGEEVYTGMKIPAHYKCPICEGNGKFYYRGFEIRCTNCNGTGVIHKHFEMKPVKVKIRRIDISIMGAREEIKYRLDNNSANIKMRSERAVFKTYDDAENYCMECNANVRNPDF